MDPRETPITSTLLFMVDNYGCWYLTGHLCLGKIGSHRPSDVGGHWKGEQNMREKEWI